MGTEAAKFEPPALAPPSVSLIGGARPDSSLTGCFMAKIKYIYKNARARPPSSTLLYSSNSIAKKYNYAARKGGTLTSLIHGPHKTDVLASHQKVYETPGSLQTCVDFFLFFFSQQHRGVPFPLLVNALLSTVYTTMK